MRGIRLTGAEGHSVDLDADDLRELTATARLAESIALAEARELRDLAELVETAELLLRYAPTVTVEVLP